MHYENYFLKWNISRLGNTAELLTVRFHLHAKRTKILALNFGPYSMNAFCKINLQRCHRQVECTRLYI